MFGTHWALVILCIAELSHKHEFQRGKKLVHNEFIKCE